MADDTRKQETASGGDWRPRVLLWFDTEFSLLDLDRARLLQVAAIATDMRLRRILPREEDVRVAIRLEPAEPLSDWAQSNLADLLEQCRSTAAVPVDEADIRLADYAARARRVAGLPAEETAVLAGNSVHADWWLARRWLPLLMPHLHYRHLDVSSLKLEWLAGGGAPFDKDRPDLLRTWFPQGTWDADHAPHDALYDVQASIAELAFYRAHPIRIESRTPGR